MSKFTGYGFITLIQDWSYIIFPKPEVFRMPLPELVDQLRLGLQQANKKARAWQDRYVSPKTGEFIVRTSSTTVSLKYMLMPR